MIGIRLTGFNEEVTFNGVNCTTTRLKKKSYHLCNLRRGSVMKNIWFDHFKTQIRKLTSRNLSSIEKTNVSRKDNIIMRSRIYFTTTFIQKVQEAYAENQHKFDEGALDRFFENTKNLLAEEFRKAIIPSLSQNAEFSISQFAVLINQNIKRYQIRSKLKFLPKYRIILDMNINSDKAGSGLTTVLAGFCFDCDPPREETWAFFDLTISHEEIATTFVKNGEVYADLLDLDSVTGLNCPFMNEPASVET